jgi:hypothetical protein
MASDRLVDCATCSHDAGAQSDVVPFDFPLGNCRNERGMDLRSPCYDQQPARVLIEPMHDSRSWHNAQLRIESEQRILQRVRRIPRARMHDQPRWLVEDEQRAILEHDVERYFLRLYLPIGLDASLDADLLSANDLVPPSKLPTIDLDGPALDPTLQSGPGILGQQPRERLIEPQPGQLERQFERMAAELGR